MIPVMQERTPAEVGDVLRQLREARHFTQANIPGVSSATVGKIERGTTDSFRRSSLLPYLDALGVIPEAYDFLLAGAPVAEVMPERADEPMPSAVFDRLRAVEHRMADLEREVAEMRGGATVHPFPGAATDEGLRAASNPTDPAAPRPGKGKRARGGAPAEQDDA